MDRSTCSLFLLILALDSVCATKRFFISAPKVFHVNVREKVFVQTTSVTTLYLEDERTGKIVSDTQTTSSHGGAVQTVELMIDREKMNSLDEFKTEPYLLLVANTPERKMTRVLVSMHRGYLFIQTNQPIYKPSDQVKYRIFALDHTMRPLEENIEISVFNPAGHRLKLDSSLRTPFGGLYSGSLHIPDVAGLGTWKIVSHYEGDKKNAATLEFKVQKFVLPSFEVVINSEERYILLERETFRFTVKAKYSYGETVNGSFHSWFRVAGLKGSDQCPKATRIIRGLEKTGSIKHGVGTVTLQAEDLKKQLQTQGCNLTFLEQEGAELVMTVSVTEQQSSEMQEAEISLPIVSRRYEIDLSRTRSYFIPGAPLEVMVLLRLPDGSAADEVKVELNVQGNAVEVVTNQEGEAFHIFNFPTAPLAEITVNVKADTTEQEKVLKRMSSSNQHYLYISVPKKKFNVGQDLDVTFQIINGRPQDSLLYYLVLSHGVLVHEGVVTVGQFGRKPIRITAQMMPSLRLICYYYNQHDVIVSDSVWVDVVDECEKKVKVYPTKAMVQPGETTKLHVEVEGKARVALVVVDQAMYALDRHNKLTAKQVFSAMESYDLGCSYGGGPDQDSIFTEAGLSFVSSASQSTKTNGFRCESQVKRRPRRSLDLQLELLDMKGNLSAELQQCCDQGFSSIPMRRSCEERKKRVSVMNADSQCAEIFFKCCLRGEALRKSTAEDNGFGRTISLLDIEEYFISNTAKYLRRNFAPSFAFTFFDVTDITDSYSLSLPDSITTWEIQAVILSPTHGFCVVEPIKLTTCKNVFVSVRLPYSVRRYEQMSVVAVIYNYGIDAVQLAVHMEQTPGLCSPGSSTHVAFVNISVEAESSKQVTFTTVPMKSGAIPFKIRLYDIEKGWEIDAIEKSLNVWTEGEEKTNEYTIKHNLKGRTSFNIDGNLPTETVPGSASNLFIKMEGAGFGESSARVLLSAKGVAGLLELPSGCAEQTMTKMAPTVLALRYLDLSQQWVQLPAGTRDQALKGTDEGLTTILTFKKDDGSYGAWKETPSSHWLTAFVVKVLSLLAERQMAGGEGQRGHMGREVANQDISNSVRFLLSVQKLDGSFSDPHPVRDGTLQGGIRGAGKDMSMTAFIAVALQHSIPFVEHRMKSDVEATITRSTSYLLSHVEELESPYAVAITAYCLAVCLPDKEGAKPAWKQLQALATLEGNGCRVWKADPKSPSQKDAITVETTAYALLTAVAHQDFLWADSASCWLVAQENYGGGFLSTQDTIVALEALAEYDVKKPPEPFSTVEAEFSVTGRSDKEELFLKDPSDRVIVELKSMIGNEIKVDLKGTGNIKMKVMKYFHLMEPKETCTLLNINVTLEGKVQYTSKILNNYQYFNENYDYNEEIAQHETLSRRRREIDDNSASENTMLYNVCVSLNSNLTGMAIADITLLSGFEANTEHLDSLKSPPELYISHYEISYGRVILYFNEFKDKSQCITFEAKQTVPISVLQPAQASFYDYYEPKKKCTIFYSAPKRSTEVSKLCSDDVCQCAERPCHEVKNLFTTNMKKGSRIQHACFHPVVDYRFVVEVLSVSFKSNFRLYNTNVLRVLKSTKDISVQESSNRVFANRLQCREELELGQQYLIMGKDGSTTDSKGKMQYLLESNTWVELVPDAQKCNTSRRFKLSCKSYDDFANDLNDCRL